MANPPEAVDASENPVDFPQVTPRDVHPTSDIRFVMVEIGKLTANVEQLITDVNGHGTKLDDLRHQVSFVKGALWIGGPLLLVVISVIGYFLSEKGEKVLDAIHAVMQ